MDCKREFTVIQIERLLLPVKWKPLDYTYVQIYKYKSGLSYALLLQ